MLKAFDHEQENFFWHSNLSSKNERNTAIQDSERWMSFNSAYINMALLSKIRTYIKKFYVKIIHYSHSMGIGFHANLVKSMQNVLKKSLRGSKKKKKKSKNTFSIHSTSTGAEQDVRIHTIFSFFSGIPFCRLVEDCVALPCLPPGWTPDFGLPPDTGGGGLALPFCGILGRDGVVEAEFLL